MLSKKQRYDFSARGWRLKSLPIYFVVTIKIAEN